MCASFSAAGDPEASAVRNTAARETMARIDPFPDAVTDQGDKEAAIHLLQDMRLPNPYAENLLRRWAAIAGVTLTADDYRRVGMGGTSRHE